MIVRDYSSFSSVLVGTGANTLPSAMLQMGNNKRLLLKAGETFANTGITIPWSNVEIGRWGEGPDPVLMSSATGRMQHLVLTGTDIQVRGVKLDSNKAVADTAAAPDIPDNGIMIRGQRIVLDNVTFGNLSIAISGSDPAKDVLVQSCNALLATGLRLYFAWPAGQNWCIRDCTAANSTRGAIIRGAGSNVLIDTCTFTNLDRRPMGDSGDYDNETIKPEAGAEDWTVINSTLTGPIYIGPLDLLNADGTPQNPSGRTRRITFLCNKITGERIRVRHGCENVLFQGNTIAGTGSTTVIELVGYSEKFNRDSRGIRCINNTISTPSASCSLMQLNAPSPGLSIGRDIEIDGNRFIAPALLANAANVPFVNRGASWASFRLIARNNWQIPAATLPRFARIGDSYLSFEAWKQQAGTVDERIA